MTSSGKPRILCVDDDPNVLEAVGRHLRRDYQLVTTVRGRRALKLLETQGPFHVIVADYEMPEMKGIELLERCREVAPDTVRILLTGQADMEIAMAAVNAGNIFRFLWKPCPVPEMRKALAAGVEQHHLMVSERVLLEQTLAGCVRTLADLLALANPAAFGRAMRVRERVRQLAEIVGTADRWQLEVSATLSQIGSLTLPAEIVEKLYAGQPLTSNEEQLAQGVPTVSAQLLGPIPRLEGVQQALLYQEKNFDGTGLPDDAVAGEEIPWGARALKIAVHYDRLEAEGLSMSLALDTMRGRNGAYDPQLLDAFRRLLGQPRARRHVRELGLTELEPGMVFEEDVRLPSGVLLIARGQQASRGLLLRLRHLQQRVELGTHFRVSWTPDPGAGGGHASNPEQEELQA